MSNFYTGKTVMEAINDINTSNDTPKPYTADEIKATAKTCEKYNKALERAREQYNKRTPLYDIEYIFPELKESEDERIRKAIKKALQVRCDGSRIISDEPVTLEEAIAWLEKQGNKSVNIDVESMVSSYEQRLESQGGTKYTPLVNMCLTSFRHGVENVLEELNLKKLEKQGEKKPADKITPKFKVGDFITNDYCLGKVIEITNDAYLLDTGQGIPFSCEHNAHLWTIQDAKDGDVLVCEDENFTIPFIAIYKCLGDTVYNYKGLKDLTFNSHCFMGFNGNFYEGEGGHVIEGIHPGTKEQRNLLFQKMKEAGYEWDAQKKEVKKIEVASKD